MAEPSFILKRHDTASPIRATLEDSNQDPVDIQGATILFKMAPISGGSITIAGTAVIDQVGAGTAVGGNMGVVHYNWTTADVAVADLYGAEWEVTFLSGTVQSFPNGDPMLVLVNPDL